MITATVSPVTSQIKANLRYPLKFSYFSVLLLSLLPLSYRIGPIQIYTYDLAFWPFLALNAAIFCIDQRIYRFHWNRLDKSILILVILLTFAQFFSEYHYNSINKITLWWKALAFYYLTRAYLNLRIIDVDTIFRWWIYFAAFLMSLGVLQLMTGSSIGLISNYFGQNLEQESVYGMLAIHRVSGTTDNPNIFGQWVVTFSLLANARLLFCKGYRLTIKFLYFLMFLLQPVLILATLSRGCILFWLFANSLLFCFWLFKSHYTFILKIFILSLILAGLLIGALKTYKQVIYLDVLAGRFDTQADMSDETRIDMIITGLKVLSKAKVQVAGTGLGAFYPYIYNKNIAHGDRIGVHDAQDPGGIHNVFLLIAVEGGLFVCLIFLLISFYTWIYSFRIWKNLKKSTAGYIGNYLLIMTTSLLMPMLIYNSTISYQFLNFLAVHLAVVTYLYQELPAQKILVHKLFYRPALRSTF